MTQVILRENGKLEVEGSLTIDSIASVVTHGIGLFGRENMVIDLARVTEVDSTAVSMLLQWQREAVRRNSEVSVINIPQNLQSLMQLYGVSELMKLA